MTGNISVHSLLLSPGTVLDGSTSPSAPPVVRVEYSLLFPGGYGGTTLMGAGRLELCDGGYFSAPGGTTRVSMTSGWQLTIVAGATVSVTTYTDGGFAATPSVWPPTSRPPQLLVEAGAALLLDNSLQAYSSAAFLSGTLSFAVVLAGERATLLCAGPSRPVGSQGQCYVMGLDVGAASARVLVYNQSTLFVQGWLRNQGEIDGDPHTVPLVPYGDFTAPPNLVVVGQYNYAPVAAVYSGCGTVGNGVLLEIVQDSSFVLNNALGGSTTSTGPTFSS